MPDGTEEKRIDGNFETADRTGHPQAPLRGQVLDWELSTLGHPLADFAYHAPPWRLAADQFRGMADKDVAALGIPTEDTYLRSYCAATGREADSASLCQRIRLRPQAADPPSVAAPGPRE